MRLLRLATAMTWDAGMLHQTTYNIVSVESADVYLDDALSTRARESIRRIVGAYFTPMTSASFHFGRAGGDYRCTFTKQSAGLRTKSGEACNEDFCAAFDVALARVAKQLRRAKRALRDDQALRTNEDMVLLAGLGRPASKLRGKSFRHFLRVGGLHVY